MVGLYHPFRDYYAADYPRGIPYKNFLITDSITQQYPWRYLAIEQIKNRRLPLWNPYSFSGMPLMGNLQSAALYPLNSIFFLIPSFPIAWSILVILQPLLAGLFMYGYLGSLVLRKEARLLGGIVYMFCGFNIAWLTWNTVGHVALWLPAILLLKEYILKELPSEKIQRRTWLLFSLLVFFESAYWLAGHIQTAFYVWILTDIYLIARSGQYFFSIHNSKRQMYVRRLLAFFGSTTVAVLVLTSIQSYEFFNLISQSSRITDTMSWQTSEGWFIPWKHLIQFIAPDFFGNPATLNYWGTWNYGEMIGYVGIAPLLLAFVALIYRRDRKILFFGALGVLGLLGSIDTWIAKIPFQLHIPFLSTSQPTRLLFVVDFSLAILAALGFDSLVRNKIRTHQIAWILAVVGIVVGFLWWYAYYIDGENGQVSRHNLILPTGLFVGAIILSAMGTIRYMPKKILIFAVLAFVSFDLLRFGWKFTPFTNAAYLYPKTGVTEFLSEQQGEFRVMSTDRELLPPNVGSMYGIQTVEGYDPLFYDRYGQLMAAWVRGEVDSKPFLFHRIITPQNPNSPIADMLNVRYILSKQEIESKKLKEVFREGQTIIYENTGAYPRAYLTERVIMVSSDQEALKALFDTTINIRTSAIVVDELPIIPAPLLPEEYATIMSYESNRVVISAYTATARVLVLSDVYETNWHVTIDSVPAPIFQTQYLLRGVLVPEGKHNVEFYVTML